MTGMEGVGWCISPTADVGKEQTKALRAAGASVSSFLGGRTQVYVASEVEVRDNGTKVRLAARRGIPVVGAAFLSDCLSAKAFLDPESYALDLSTQAPSSAASILETDLVSWKSRDGDANAETDNLRGSGRGAPQREGREREVQVMVSSTFRDMKEERRILNKVVLPQLEAVCRPRGVKVSFLDLKWGILASDRQGVINRSLAAVDRCRPYFLGVLGERYGYSQHESLPEDEDLAAAFSHALPRHSWLSAYRDKSVTELEITYGALHPEYSPLWSRMKEGWGGAGGEEEARRRLGRRALIYMRDPLLITKKYSLGDPERADYEEESSEGYEKLADLKRRLRTLGGNTDSPFVLRDGYGSYEAFGSQVLADLTALIESDYPVLEEDERQQVGDALHEARPALEAQFLQFMRQGTLETGQRSGKRMGVQARRKKEQEEIRGRSEPLLVTGPEGVGKSELLRTWQASAAPTCKILSVDRQDSLQTSRQVAERLVGLLHSLMGGTGCQAACSDLELKLELRSAIAAVGCLIGAGDVPGIEQCVIILDGLEALGDLDLSWIPDVLPASVRLVAVVRDIAVASLRAADERWQQWPCLPVPGFTKAEVRSHISSYMQHYSKSLEREHIERLVGHAACASPLFLRTVLDELRLSASFDTLGREVGKCAAAHSLPALLSSILATLESEAPPTFSRAVVGDVFGLLAMSHKGLSAEEILAALGREESGEWQRFLLMVSRFFSTSPSGVLSFTHEALGQAVRSRYLQGERPSRLAAALSPVLKGKLLEPRCTVEYAFLLLSQEEDEHSKEEMRRLLRNVHAVGGAYALPQGGSVLRRCFELAFSSTDQDGESLRMFDENAALGERGEERAVGAADFLRDVGLYAEAAALLQTFISDGQRGNNVLLEAALALERVGDLEGAGRAVQGEAGSGSLAARFYLTRARLMKKMGRYEDAVAMIGQAREDVLVGVGGKHPIHAEFSMLEADIKRKLGRLDDALELYEEAVDVISASYGRQTSPMADLQRCIGMVLKKKSLYERAIKAYYKALDVLEKIYGVRHPDFAGTLMDVADVYRKLGKLSVAQAMYEQAEGVFVTALGPQHVSVGECLNSLGLLFKKQGQYQAAGEYYARALDVFRHCFGEGHYKHAVSLVNLADVHRKQAQYDEATRLYHTALGVLQDRLGAGHLECADVLNALGLVEKKRGRYGEARAYYEAALKIVMQEVGGVHLKTGVFLNNLADVLRKEGDYEKAKQVYARALEVLTCCVGANHPEVAEVLQCLALVHIAQGDHTEAERLLDNAWRIIADEYDAGHPKAGYCLDKKGSLAYARMLYPEARRLHEEALAVLRKSLPETHPEVADVQLSLAHVLLKMHDDVSAVRLFSSACVTFGVAYGTQHYKYEAARRQLAKMGAPIPDLAAGPAVASASRCSEDWRQQMGMAEEKQRGGRRKLRQDPSSQNALLLHSWLSVM